MVQANDALVEWCENLRLQAGLTSIVLGGRRAVTNDLPMAQPGTSDIDLYAFCATDVFNHIPHALWGLQGAGTRLAFRLRSTYIEAHYQSVMLPEIDLKVMRWATVDAILNAPPSLDELYLEKMHSLQNYKILVDEANEAIQRIDTAKLRISNDIKLLLPYAFESYLKHIWGVVKQGLRRNEPLIGASLAHRALGFLIIIEYLLNDIYPPPFKWRMKESELSGLRRGRMILDTATSLEVAQRPTLELYAQQIRRLEAEIFQDPGMKNIPGTKPDAWWWEPTA